MKFLNDNKQFKKALELFDEHKKNDTEICSSFIITQALKACTHLGDLQRGLSIHRLCLSRLTDDLYISASLIHLYMQCGDKQDAQSIFDNATKRTPSMYGAMMTGYIRNNQPDKALRIFTEINKPDRIILILLFNACAQLGTAEALNLTKQVAQKIPKSFYSNVRLLTSLLDALMKCGDVRHAESLFHQSNEKVLSMYGAMMKGYIENSMADKAIDLFHQIKDPNEVNVVLLFNACAQLGTAEALNLTKQVAQKIPKSFYSNVRLLTSLLDALMKCGDVKHAESLFHHSNEKVLQMYGAMMKGYIRNNQSNEALRVFTEINKPDEVILILLFNACAQLGTAEALNLTKQVAQEIPKSFYSDVRLLTSLLDALMKCGDVKHAESLFDQSNEKVLQMYGAMMKGYIRNNQPNEALRIFTGINNPDEVILILLFNACAQLGTVEALNLTKQVAQEIPKSFYSDVRLLTSLLDALMKCGDVKHAESLFDQSNEKVSSMYGAMMNGFNKEKNPVKTLNLFNQMKIDGFDPNVVIYSCVIKALSQIGDYSLSQSIIEQMPNTLLLDNQIHNILVDMWGKSGCVDRAKEIFEKISQPNEFGYASMINCYGLNGMGTEAIELYYKTPSKLITEATNVSVLNACSHSGLVDQARSIFTNIENKTEKIYCTIVDCLSRASFFKEAQELIDDYERFSAPSEPIYMALLSGARNEKNKYLSEQVFDRMKKLFPQSIDSLTSAAVLLANVYGSLGDIEKASNVRRQLVKSGAKKKVGLSWTVVNGQLYQFRAHDRSSPQSDAIYAEVEKMSKELLQHGHQYDSSWVTRSVKEDETIASVLCGHSEKLAIAWNFVANPTTKRIQVTKNLRVCGDCHGATKLIAAIRRCEIIVRDANRIHHFHTTGKCSCNDYF